MKLAVMRRLGVLLPLFLISLLLSGCGRTKGKDPISMEKNSTSIPSSMQKNSVPGPKKLNLGCANDIREGYDNIDLYYYDPRVIKMDIRKLTYGDNTVDEVLCSHVLEHLALRDVPIVLKGVHRVLKEGGRIIVDVPDLEATVKMWLDLPEEERWGKAFVGIYGSQEYEGNFHKCGFTKARLRKVLTEAGFKSVDVKGIISHGGPSIYAEAKK